MKKICKLFFCHYIAISIYYYFKYYSYYFFSDELMVLNANYFKDKRQMGHTAIKNSTNAALQESTEIEKEEAQPSLIDWGTIWKPLGLIVGIFVVFFWLPVHPPG